MRTVAITMIMTVVFLDADGRADSSLEILTPPEHISIYGDQIYLVGKTSAHLVKIDIDQQEVYELPVVDSMFHILLKFGYGLNEITIAPVDSGSDTRLNESKEIQVLAGPWISNKYERMYVEYNFHKSEPRDDCTGCHKNGSNDAVVVNDARFCFGCHAEMPQRFKTHIPDDEGACARCHRISGDLTLVSTGEYSDENPCYTCHKDKIGQFAQEYVHGPVAGGSCAICHDPHGSEFENNLINPVGILCSSCHASIEKARKYKLQHPPFEKGICCECHNPHSTNNKWVLTKKSQEVCIPCHIKEESMEFHDHPYNIKPKKRILSSLKLTDKGQLECLSCHNPHATDTEHLLRTTQGYTCLGCHPDR